MLILGKGAFGLPTLAEISDLITGLFHKLLIGLDILIYKFAALVYRIFLLLATTNPDTVNLYNQFVNRIYVLLGIIMLFVLIYGLLQGVINPDKAEEKDIAPQKFLLNVVLSIVLIIVMPVIFKFARNIQITLLNNNVVQKLIFGDEYFNNQNGSNTITIKSAGQYMSATVFFSFFHASDAFCTNKAGNSVDQNVLNSKENAAERLSYCEKFIPVWEGDIDGNINFGQLLSDYKEQIAYSQRDFADLKKFHNWTFVHADKDNLPSDDIAVIDHNFPISAIAGIFLCYVMISFCFDLGKRVVKLMFLQIIAPIPIICMAIPKAKDVFDKWTKMTIAVYLEAIVRLAAMFFGVYLIMKVPELNIWANSSREDWYVILIGDAFIIMGILAFIKELPKFLSSLLPSGFSSDNMKLGIRDKLKDGGFFTAATTAGATATGLARGITRPWHGIKDRPGKGKYFKAFAKSIGGGVASSISGARYGLMKGRKADSFSDVKKAASEAASQVDDNASKRQQYISSHGGVRRAAAGRVGDAFRSIGHWAGFGNKEALKVEINNLEDLKAANKSLLDTAESTLEKAIAKSSAAKNKSYGLGQQRYAVSSDMRTFLNTTLSVTDRTRIIDASTGELKISNSYDLKLISDALANAQLNPSSAPGVNITALNGEFANDVKKKHATKVAEQGLLSDSHYDGLADGDKVDLAEIRTEGIKYRGKLATNLTDNVVSSSNITYEDVKKSKDITLDNNPKIKNLGDAIDLALGDYKVKLTEFEEEEKKKDAGKK